eukprot:526775_1
MHSTDVEEKHKEDEETEQIVFKKAQSIMVTGTDNKRVWFEDYYQLEELLGEPGTFGMAYKCHKKTDKNKTSYAVKKIIKTKYYFDKNALNVLENMKNEIKILNMLTKNEYICSLFEVYEDRNYLYLLLDYLSGGELLTKIEDEDGLTEIYSVSILKQILSAINYMHQNNIVHLDLKPDNILFVTSQQIKIKIIDFGEAKVMKSKNDKINVKIGTPYYMSPEIIIDNPSVNPFKSDIWSIGVITFCMLFGFIPFYSEDNDEKIIFKNIKNGFKHEICAGYGAWYPMDIPISNEGMKFISGMLTYNPMDRFSIEECLNHKWLQTPLNELTFPQVQTSAEIADKPETLRGGYEVYINQDDYCEIKTQMDEIIDDNVIKQGYLYKEGKLFKTWKKRWFVLNKNGCVSYYGSHMEQEPKGTFNIKNYNQIIKSKKIKCGIIVCTADRNYKLICSNNKSRDEWINGFKMFQKNNENKNNNLELEKFKNLLKNGVKCGSGDIFWIQKNCYSKNKYVLKLQQHTKENDMIKFSRKVGFWSNHTDKYRIILGEKHSNKYLWMEIYHSSKWNDVQQKYDHYKSMLML